MEKQIFTIVKNIITKPTPWSQNEDELLMKLSNICYYPNRRKIHWKKVATYFSCKSPSQCYRRFLAINPNIKKGKWTKEEDELLLSLIDQFGKSWSFISKIIKNRSSAQIRMRYNNHLSPEIVKKKFTKEEDNLIKNLYEKYLNRWSKYNQYLPGRSLKNIKRRYLRLINKKII